MIGREKMAKAAVELAEHLQIVENIRALQIAQKQLADELNLINKNYNEVRAEISILRAEIKFEAIKETQIIINGVQGGLNQRLEAISNKLAVMEVDRVNSSTVKFLHDVSSKNPLKAIRGEGDNDDDSSH